MYTSHLNITLRPVLLLVFLFLKVSLAFVCVRVRQQHDINMTCVTVDIADKDTLKSANCTNNPPCSLRPSVW